MKGLMCTVRLLQVVLTVGSVLGFTPAIHHVSKSSYSKSSVVKYLPSLESKASLTELGLFSAFGRQSPAVVEDPVVAGIGEDGCKLPAPSRINTLAKPFQAKAFFGIFSALFLGTQFLSSFLGDVTTQYEWFQSFRCTWPILGAIFVAAGITHFTVEEEYCNIFPSQGAWGIWYLPGSAKFHVRWTGVAEILGGLGLCIGGIMDAFAPVYYSSPNLLSDAGLESDAAALLFLLTIAVTPANIYMYTHGAKLPMDGPTIPISFHAIRGIMQVVLLGLLFQMGEGTFEQLLS
jgi:uncharacterized membrane protein